MNEFSILGKILVLSGLILVVIGLFFLFGGKIPWLGKLPGDMRVHNKNFSFYFPLTTCILISFILSLIFWLWSKR